MGKKAKRKLKTENNPDKVFRDYYLNYCNEKNIDTRERQIKRQRYVFDLLNKYGSENSNIEKLIDMVTDDIHHQYSIKQDIENKAGFMIALWGVIVAAILQLHIPAHMIQNIKSMNIAVVLRMLNALVLGGLVICCVTALVLSCMVLLSGVYSRFLFDDKDTHYKCAVDNKNMSLVLMLDINTNIWIQNENANEQKFTYLRNLIISIVVFIILTLVAICLGGVF